MRGTVALRMDPTQYRVDESTQGYEQKLAKEISKEFGYNLRQYSLHLRKVDMM